MSEQHDCTKAGPLCAEKQRLMELFMGAQDDALALQREICTLNGRLALMDAWRRRAIEAEGALKAADPQGLLEELDAYREAAQYDFKMEGAVFCHWNRSQLDRARAMTEAAIKSARAKA